MSRVRAHRVRRLLAPAVLVGTVLAACGGDDGGSTTPTLPPTTASTTPATTAPGTTAPADTTEPATTAPDTTTADTGTPGGAFAFESDDGRVVAVFPAEPTESELPVALPDGDVLPSPLFLVESDDYAMFLSWTDFGLTITDPDEQLAVLEDARDGAISGFNGELISSEAVDIDGRVGLDFVGGVIAGADEARYQSLVTLDGDRLYQVVSVTVVGSDAEELGRAFLDSFQFTGAPS